MVRVEVASTPTPDGLNALAIVGRASTANVAEAPAAVPALVVVTFPVALRYEPAAALITFTVTVHELPAGMVAPESAAVEPLFRAVTGPPGQVCVPFAQTAF